MDRPRRNLGDLSRILGARQGAIGGNPQPIRLLPQPPPADAQPRGQQAAAAALGAQPGGAQGGQYLPDALTAARVRLEIQRNLDWSSAWWTGRERWWGQEEAAGRREPVYRQFLVPLPRPRDRRADFPPGFSSSLPPPPPVSAGERRWARYERLVQDFNERRGRFQALRADVAAGRAFPYFMRPIRPTGLRLTKILGKGGQGIVGCFEVRDGDGVVKKVVIKGALRDEYRMRRFLANEKRNVLVSLLYTAKRGGVQGGIHPCIGSSSHRLALGVDDGAKPRRARLTGLVSEISDIH